MALILEWVITYFLVGWVVILGCFVLLHDGVEAYIKPEIERIARDDGNDTARFVRNGAGAGHSVAGDAHQNADGAMTTWR